ncbi:hypothetical protein [Halobacterium sp. BOL4-2]|uniref:hypothetical protein n=1 Tax=Halobacterium sp. BOL4-2 TaxID=2810537 RepID=UPI001963E675|nr:hypothetical protein [Halobacterium sp. BOL4-2]QRY26391.1 hypothetical protein JRZ79_13150 [Halobacterium sp. BOL4-2]
MATSSLQAADVLDERDARALTQDMSVREDAGWARGAPDCYLVDVADSGASYRVNARAGRCSCPAQFWRGHKCTHLARVAFATGSREIPDWVQDDRVDPQLGYHLTEAQP